MAGIVLDIYINESSFKLLMQRETFNIGDLITLISGSAQMIVAGYNRNGLVNCATWIEGHLINFNFPEDTLQKIQHNNDQVGPRTVKYFQ